MAFRAAATRLFRSATAWGMASLALRGASLVGVLPLTLHSISPETLALWYFFGAVLSAVPVLDLGFCATVGRILARKLAGGEAGGDFPDPLAAYTTEEAVSGVLRFYRAFALVCSPLLAVGGGAWIVWHSHTLPNARAILAAWLLLCPALPLAAACSCWRGLFFGINEITRIQVALSVGQVCQIALTVAGLLCGFGIVALAAGNLAFNLVPAWLLWRAGRRSPLFGAARRRTLPTDGAVIRAVLRSSSRVFMNMVGIYLILNAGLLIGPSFLDLRTIASYSLSLQLLLVAALVAALWLEVKQPLFARLYVSGPEELRRLFLARMRWVIGTYALAMAMLLATGPWCLHVIHARTSLLPPAQLAVLATFVFLQMHHSLFESLSLCLHRNPFSLPFLASAAAACLLVATLGRAWGVWGLVLAPLLSQAAFNNWWVPAYGLRLLGISPGRYLLDLARGPQAGA